ncbi:MAG: amidohydrolase family protein [Gemmatimonadota bacterium]|nr:amidohydrolase family protein [Gemmatimonadota bacterium]
MHRLMTRRPRTRLSASTPQLLAGCLSLAVLTACGGADQVASADVTVFEGARLITGTGEVIDDAVFVVDGDRFTQVGAMADEDVPVGATVVDLAGRTVIPAIVNAHIHLSSDAAERAQQLRHMAYYGAGTVVSLGLDEGSTAFEMAGVSVEDGARSFTAGRGITGPEPGRSEVPYWVTTPDEARTAVQELASQDADIVKIWVDDRGGQYERLSPDLYGAVIDEAHAHDLKVTAHIFRLEDAKGLLRAGIDAFAHGIRDGDVDDEVIGLWLERPNVVLVPNLPGPGVPVDMTWISTLPPERVQEMQDGQQARPAVQEAFGIQARNLARLDDEGITIAFGTDGSTPWAVHHEMEDMVRSGMSAADVIVAATSSSAALMELDDVGAIAPGMSADFIVLGADPLDDIRNTRRIEAVYLRGTAIDREAIRAEAMGAGGA